MSEVTATPKPLLGRQGSTFAGAARDKTQTRFPKQEEEFCGEAVSLRESANLAEVID